MLELGGMEEYLLSSDSRVHKVTNRTCGIRKIIAMSHRKQLYVLYSFYGKTKPSDLLTFTGF